MRYIALIIRPFLISLLLLFAAAGAASAQYAQFSKSTITASPITFNLGGGVIGTVTFSGATASTSGLQSPTVSGTNLVSNFVIIQPGAIATVTFNYPLSHLDLQWGTGNTVARTDNFVFNTAQSSNIALPLATNLATRSGSFSGTGLDIVSFRLSSTSASPLTLGVLTTTAAVPAPLDPIGATLFGNVAAIGAVVFFRRRRKMAMRDAIHVNAA